MSPGISKTIVCVSVCLCSMWAASVRGEEGGHLYAVGENGYGQLCDKGVLDHVAPVESWGIPVFLRAVAAGGLHGLAIKLDEGVAAWGDHRYGQVGCAEIGDEHHAQQYVSSQNVPGLTVAVAVGAG